MLEFIIALLLSLGFTVDDRNNLYINAENIDVIRAESMYDELGGDTEFKDVFQADPFTNGSQDFIVIGVDPNPPSN